MSIFDAPMISNTFLNDHPQSVFEYDQQFYDASMQHEWVNFGLTSEDIDRAELVSYMQLVYKLYAAS